MLKIMSLNIWGGHVYEKLLDFIQTHQDVDVFCFQEVYHNAKTKMASEGKSFYNVSSTNMVEAEIFLQKVEHQKFMSGFRVEEKGTGPDLERKISDAEGRLQDCEMQLRVLDAKPRPLSTEDERKASGLRSEASSARSRLAALRSRSV